MSAIYTHNEAANSAQSRTVTLPTGIWLETSRYDTHSQHSAAVMRLYDYGT
jgi:hypothetical protein